MKNNLFDNIGKKLNDYQSPVDFDKEWSGILDRQNQEKKEKRFIWGFSFLGGLLCVLAFWVFLYVNADTPSKVVKESLIETEKKTNLHDRVINNKATKNAQLSIRKSLSINKREKTKETTVLFNQKKESVSTPLGGNAFAEKPNDPIFLPKKSNTSDNTTTNETRFLEPANLALLPTKNAFLNIPKNEIAIGDPQITQSNTNSTKRKKQIYVNTGLAMTKQNIRAREASVEEYSTLRTNSEVALETYTYDVGLNIPFGKKSFVSFGSSYNISFDKINHQYDIAKDFDFENVLIRRRVFMPSGMVEEIFGDTTITGSQTILTTQFNQYNSANLNASLGYYLYSKKRLSIAVRGGVFYNISLQTKGKIISQTDQEGALVEIDGYKKSFGLGLRGGADFDYQLSELMVLNLRPFASYALFSATKNSNALKSNFYSYGLSLGIKFNLQ